MIGVSYFGTKHRKNTDDFILLFKSVLITITIQYILHYFILIPLIASSLFFIVVVLTGFNDNDRL